MTLQFKCKLLSGLSSTAILAGVGVILLFTVTGVDAQTIPGLPQIDRYAPEIYRAHNQNWAAAQDSLGIMYFGNTSGVLVYNARQWRLIPTPKKTAVRGLVLGRDGRIYVGGQSEFGYLAPDSTGKLSYVSLTGNLTPKQKNFSDIWIALSTRKGVYFMSSERLFRYNYTDHTISSWKPKTDFYFIYHWHSRLYVQEPKVGLLEMNDDTLRLVNNSALAKKATINNMLPYSSGKALIATGNSGFYLFDGKTFKPFPIQDGKQIRDDDPYVSLNLPDRTYMIGTLKDGIFQIDHNGRLVQHYNKSNGLQDNVVLNMFSDREGDIWVEHENGISKINWNSNAKFFYASVYNFMGPVLSMKRFNKTLYIGTGLGLYRMTHEAGHITTRGYLFKPVNDIVHQIWSLLATSDKLIAATGRGTFSIDKENHVVKITPDESFKLYRPSAQSDTIYVGQEKGVLILKKGKKDGWVDAGKIPGLHDEIRSLYQTRNHTLWLATDYNGIFRVKKQKNGQWKIDNYNESNGLPAGTLRLYRINGHLIIGTENGFYSFKKNGNGILQFTKTNLFRDSKGINAGIVNFKSLNSNHAWVVFKDSVDYIIEKNGKLIFQHSPYRHFRDFGITSVFMQDNTVTWFGTNSLLIKYVMPDKKVLGDRFRTLITRITTSSGKNLFTTYGIPGLKGHRRVDNLGMFHSSHKSFRFYYTSTTFRDERKTRYRYKLEGFDNKWSAWSAESYKEYSNLPAGNYVFEVIAINANGIVGQPAKISFGISAPWYETYWSFMAYIFIAIGLVYGVGKVRDRYWEKRNRDLEDLIDKHTRKMKDQNEELQLKNKSLSELNQLRNEFLNMASHDLKNPLIGIEGMSRILIEDMEEGRKTTEEILDENLEILRMIHDSSRYMNDIISNLLDSTAIESGSVTILLKETDLVAQTKTILDEMKESAQNKRINFNFKSPGTAIAMCDSNRTRQVLENIIVNAVKYSFQGSEIDITISKTTNRIKNGIQLTVRDYGPGFTDEDLKKVFGKFQRLSAKPTDGESSTGLGLYIAKSFVDLQKGEIWVENHPFKGAIFYIELPGVG